MRHLRLHTGQEENLPDYASSTALTLLLSFIIKGLSSRQESCLFQRWVFIRCEVTQEISPGLGRAQALEAPEHCFGWVLSSVLPLNLAIT